MEPDKKRYTSRIVREMNQNKHRPFNSPPTSTGSHGTITQGLTTLSLSPPDGESTPRKRDDSQSLPRQPRTGRFGVPAPKPAAKPVHTSAIGRVFPEWATDASAATTTQDPVANAMDTTDVKENIPPHTIDSKIESTVEDTMPGSKRPRSHMQPRVQDESACSTVLSTTAGHPLAKARLTHLRTRRSQQAAAAVASESETPCQPSAAASDVPAKSPVMEYVAKLRVDLAERRAAQEAKRAAEATPTQPPTPKEQPARRSFSMGALHNPSPLREETSATSLAKAATVNPTSRSFFLPNLVNLADFASGTLRFNGAMSNGVPVFVKRGRVHDRARNTDLHADVDAIEVPLDEQEIFVSMDMIRDEIVTLQEHDDMVQREAEQLQDEVVRLNAELQSMQGRKSSDSAFGSGSESSQNTNERLRLQKKRFDALTASLQKELSRANRQISINDIHHSSLAAERDEALRQASLAHQKAKELQAQLDSSQKTLDLTNQMRQDKDTLDLENKSLRADNDSLRREQQSLARDNHTIRSNYRKLIEEHNERRENHAALQNDVTSLRKLVEALRTQLSKCDQDRKMFQQDNYSLADENEKLFKETKELQHKNSMLERRMSDMREQNVKLQQLVDQNLNMTTTEIGLYEENSRLRVQVDSMRERFQQFEELENENSELKSQAKAANRLKQENAELQTQLAAAKDEAQQLSDKRYNMVSEEREALREENRRLEDLLYKSRLETSERTDQLLRFCEQGQVEEAAHLEKETTLTKQVERRDQAVLEVRRLTKEIAKLEGKEPQRKASKTARIVEPKPSRGSIPGEVSAKSSTSIVGDEDPTTQVDVDEGSDFGSIFTKGEIPQLREKLRQTRKQQEQQANEDTETGLQTIESESVSLSVPIMRRALSDDDFQRSASIASKGLSGSLKAQPHGILKKSSQFTQEDTTGKLSVRSGVSMASMRSNQSSKSAASVQSRRSSRNPNEASGPESRHHRRFNSDTTGIDIEDNMTSGFFMPDITLESRKEAKTSRPSEPSLSKDARRVLDGLCKHDCSNCSVCARLTTHKQHASDGHVGGKKTVQIQKPVPVSDRTFEKSGYEDEATMRPSQPPGQALAKVIKGLQDEVDHLKMQLVDKQALYNAKDASCKKRESKAWMREIRALLKQIDAKNDQVYALHDVLEGQKQAGQTMTEEELEMTVMSITNGAVTMDGTQSTWNGIQG